MDTTLSTHREPTLRVVARPNDANASGDIFGGWLMSQIDIAGAIAGGKRAKGPVATVAVKELRFIEPLFIYDLVSFYTEVVSVGRTSITVHIEVLVERLRGIEENLPVKAADATFVYVAVAQPGIKREIPL